MNQMYGFEGEVKAKYTAQMFQLFSEVFQWLPLAQCINNKVLVSFGNKQPEGFIFLAAIQFDFSLLMNSFRILFVSELICY